MPIERRYTQGSIIYFGHEIGDSIFVVKSGRIDISYIQPESGEKITKTLNQGEFFGLKSAIINHTREEVVEAVTESVAIDFKIPEFEIYVSKNVELMKRLLRVLSNQLRNLGIKVNNYLGNNVIYPPNIGLFKIGEYYLVNKQYKQAIQVYERYMQQYPQTNIVGEAKYRISISEEAIKTGFLKEFKPIEQIVEQDVHTNSYSVADTKAPLDNAHSKLGVREFMDKFYKAESFYNGQDYSNSEKQLMELFKIQGDNINSDMVDKAKFMYINTLFKLNKFKECSQEINEYLKITKNVITIKQILFILADIYMSLSNKDGEKSILQKIIVMSPVDGLTRKAKERFDNLK